MTSGLGWISPGQWGQAAWLGFLIACLGSLVVTRAARADVTLSFLGFYMGLLIVRALWLGDPLMIPLHHLESGTLLIFSFFMITDPKTTPDSRAGRLLFTLSVAFVALCVQFILFRPHAPLWALLFCSPLVPLIDRCIPGSRYDWSRPSDGRLAAPITMAMALPKEGVMTRPLVCALLLLTGLLIWTESASAFCGFYVAKADSKLFNKASEVAIARASAKNGHHDGERLHRRREGVRAGRACADRT
jgi:NQR2, RnfD, RnfE family